MLRLRPAIFALLLASPCFAAAAAATAADTAAAADIDATAAARAAADPAVRAKDLLAALKAGEWEKAAVPFDAAMKAALPPSGLQAMWAQLRSQAGALKSEGPLRAVRSDGITTVLQRLGFEAAELDLRVAVRDETGEIAGLFVTPPSEEGTPIAAQAVGTSDVEALPPEVQIAPAPAAPVDPVSIATTFLDDLERGRFEDGAARFDATITSMLPPDKLAGIWAELGKNMGKLQQRGEPKSAVGPQGTVVTQRLDFAGGALDMNVTVTSGGRIAGLFFAPVKAESAPPPPDAPFVERPIAVGSGGGSLPGLLTMPRGAAPIAVAVLVHGSGPQDRDETIGPNKPFRDIAWGLAERGIASIRYDKRTLAHQQALASMAPDITVDQETVLDAVAALKLAAQLPDMGAHPPVILVGHSLGAMVAPRIAQRAPEIAGIVFLAAPAGKLEDAILRQTESIFMGDGTIDASERAQLDEVARQVALVKSPALSLDTPSLSLPLGVPPRYWLDLRGHDPVKEAAALPVPMLFIQGGRDYQVTTKDLDAYRAELGARKDVSFVVLPQLNHLLVAGSGPAGPGDYMAAGRVAAEPLDAIAAFAKRLAPAAPAR